METVKNGILNSSLATKIIAMGILASSTSQAIDKGEEVTKLKASGAGIENENKNFVLDASSEISDDEYAKLSDEEKSIYQGISNEEGLHKYILKSTLTLLNNKNDENLNFNENLENIHNNSPLRANNVRGGTVHLYFMITITIVSMSMDFLINLIVF